MRGGQLRHRITLQTKTTTRGTSGSARETWADSFTVPAAYEPLGSREFPATQKRNSETTARFRIRYQAGIDADQHRILFTLDPDSSHAVTQIFNIFPPLPADGQRRELIIEASEVK